MAFQYHVLCELPLCEEEQVVLISPHTVLLFVQMATLLTLSMSPTPTNYSYMVSIGLIDRLGDHFNTIVGPIQESSLTHLVLGGLNLLVTTTACMHAR